MRFVGFCGSKPGEGAVGRKPGAVGTLGSMESVDAAVDTDGDVLADAAAVPATTPGGGPDEEVRLLREPENAEAVCT